MLQGCRASVTSAGRGRSRMWQRLAQTARATEAMVKTGRRPWTLPTKPSWSMTGTDGMPESPSDLSEESGGCPQPRPWTLPTKSWTLPTDPL